MLYYDPSKNPSGACIDGVPLRDLTKDEFDALPTWLQANVAACDFYTFEAPPSPATGPEARAPLAADPAQHATIDEVTGSAENSAPRRRR